MIPGTTAVRGQRGPGGSVESVTGLTRGRGSVIAPMLRFARGVSRRNARGAVWMARNGLEPVRGADFFLIAGSDSPGNDLLRAGAEPLGGRASETAGGANLHPVHLPTRSMASARRCSLDMSTAPARRSPAGWKCPLRRPLGPVQLASTSAERVQHSLRCSTGWTKSVRHSGVKK